MKLTTIAVIAGLAIVTTMAGCGKSESSSSLSSKHKDESAESFISRAVEKGAGVSGRASVVCGPEKRGVVEFSGKFEWSDADQYQTFTGKLSGHPGNWTMTEFTMRDPIQK